MSVCKHGRMNFQTTTMFALLMRYLLSPLLLITLWGSNASAQQSVLGPNQWLMPGEYMSSPNGIFKLYMQTDGNLVLYDMRYQGGQYGNAMWHTGTYMYPGARAVMQSDGNFVVYDGAIAQGYYWARWNAGVIHWGASLYLQNDGNLVIYGPSGAVPWHTNTPRYAPTQSVDGFTPLSAPSSLVSSTILGTLPVSHNVDVRGGVSVSIPLELPGGVNGIEPNLSLSLSSAGSIYSQAANSGTWSLGGLDSIDFDYSPIRLSGAGVLVPEILNPPWNIPQTYRVKRNPDVVVAEQRIQSSWWYTTWYQAKKNGNAYRYGRDESAQEFDDNGNGRYLLQEVEDEFGNLMRIDYLALSELSWAKVPVLIRYGGYRVELSYSLHFGEAKLHTIKTKIGTTLVSEYLIVPGTVDSVQKCGYDVSGVNRTCLPPVTTQWTTPAAQRKQLTVFDGLGNKTETIFAPRSGLGAANALFASSEIPFAMPALGAFGEFNAQAGFDDDWVAIQSNTDNGLGGVNVSDYAYRSPDLRNDTLRKRMVDGTYFYASYIPDVGYQGNYSGQLSKQARYSAIAGASGAKKLSFEESTWELFTWDKYNGAQPTYIAKFPFLTKRKQHILDDNGNIVGGQYTSIDYSSWNTVTGFLGQTVATTVSGFDTSGEAITTTVQKVSTTTTDYSNNSSTWIVGFPTSTKAEVTMAGLTKGVKIDRTPYSSTTHKIGTEVLSANNGVGYVAQTNTTTLYDAKGNPSSTTVTGSDFATRYTTYSNYIDDRYVGAITQPTGNGYTVQGSMSYDLRFGLPSSVTDSNNGLTAYTVHDSLGQIAQQISPNGAITTTARESCVGSCGSYGGFTGGQPKFKVTVTTTHPSESNKGAPTQVAYFDSLGRVIRVETEGFASGQWSAVDTVYNALGQVWKTSLPYQISAYANPQYAIHLYDEQGRVASVSRPDGSSTVFAYQQLSNVFRLTKTENIVGPGGTRTEVRVEEYDSLGQLKKGFDAYGTGQQVFVDYRYEHSGKVDRVLINNDDNTTVYLQHDAFGRVLSIEDPNTGLVSFSYDKIGQLRYRMDAEGVTTRFDYDAIGRVYQRTDDLSGSNQVINNWTFDTKKVGFLSSRSRPGFYEELYYNAYAQVQQIATNITTSAYSGSFSSVIGRDNYGRMTSQTYPSGVVAGTTYNAQGYSSELRDNRTNGLISRVDAINSLGLVTQQTAGNGYVTTRSYDASSGRLASLQTGNGAIQNYTYQWWSDGSLFRRNRVDINASETLTYDNLSRLDYAATSTTSGPRNLDYTYNALGNLTAKVEGANSVPLYNYSTVAKPHRLDSAQIGSSTHFFGHDVKGNITLIDAPGTADDRRFTYDATGKMLSITKGDINSPVAKEEFLYDPDGARFLRVSLVNGVTAKTVYLYGGAFELILPGSGTVTAIAKSYVGSTLHIHQTTSSGEAETFEYLYADHLGSIEVITNSSGAVVQSNSFDPFGGRRAANWTDDIGAPSVIDQQLHTSRGFTGHEHLYAAGLIHMNGRLYDPVLGRFISADPIVPDPTFSQSYNRYSYVRNNPLTRTDPSGFQDCQEPDCTTLPDISALPSSLEPDFSPSAAYVGALLDSIADNFSEALSTAVSAFRQAASNSSQEKKSCSMFDFAKDLLVALADQHLSLSVEGSLLLGSSTNRYSYKSVSFGITTGLQLFLNVTESASLRGLTTASGQALSSVSAGSIGLNTGYGSSMYRQGVTNAEFLGAYAYAGGGASWDGQIGDGSLEGDLHTEVPRRLGILDVGAGAGADIVRGDVKNFTMASRPLFGLGPTRYSRCGGRID